MAPTCKEDVRSPNDAKLKIRSCKPGAPCVRPHPCVCFASVFPGRMTARAVTSGSNEGRVSFATKKPGRASSSEATNVQAVKPSPPWIGRGNASKGIRTAVRFRCVAHGQSRWRAFSPLRFGMGHHAGRPRCVRAPRVFSRRRGRCLQTNQRVQEHTVQPAGYGKS